MSFMKKTPIIIALFLIPSLVSAGVISLTTTVSTDIMNTSTGQIQIMIVNSGDEAAHDVQLSLISEDFDSDPVYVGILQPNSPFEGTMNITLNKGIFSGNYPLVLLTEYTDANGYPFSSVSPVTLTYKTRSVSMLSGIFSDISLLGKNPKNLPLTIRNVDDVPHYVKVKLFLSRELKVDESEKRLTIESKGEEELNFRVSNLGGLEGSSYVVLASVEYDEDFHYSSFGRGMIRIGSEKNKGHVFSNAKLVGYVILLLSVFIILLYLRSKIEFKKKGEK